MSHNNIIGSFLSRPATSVLGVYLNNLCHCLVSIQVLQNWERPSVNWVGGHAMFAWYTYPTIEVFVSHESIAESC